VAAPEALVYHAVEEYLLPQAIRLNLKWRHLGFVIKRHPELRRHFTNKIFWRRTHRDVVLLVLGAALASRMPAAVLLGAPWVYRRLIRRGTHRGALVVSALELPGALVVDIAELGTMCWGSVQYRTVML
jgi:hypothetical protein